MNDLRKLPIYKYACALACALFCALSPVQGIAQTGGSMSYLMGDGSIKVITQGIGVTYSDPPSGTIRAGQVLPAGTGTAVGNSRLSMSGGNVVAKTSGSLPLGAGRSAAIDVVSKVVKPSAAAALGRLAGKIIYPISVGIALYDFMKEMGFNPELDPDGSGVILSKTIEGIVCASGCYEYNTNVYSLPWVKDPKQACINQGKSYPSNVATISGSGQYVTCYWTQPYSGGTVMSSRPVPPYNTSTVQPATIEDFENLVKSRDDYPDSSKFADAVAQAVNSGESVSLQTPIVSGPSTVDGSTTTTTNPDGSTTTATEKKTLSYSGDTVTINTTNITSNYNPTTNQTTTTTSQTTNEPPIEEKDPCKLNPDSLMCTKPDLDTPDGEIPKETFTVSYTPDDLGFGGGSCPSDVMLTLHGMPSIKAWDWASSCSKIVTYVKPMILALASFAALMIIFAPGRES